MLLSAKVPFAALFVLLGSACRGPLGPPLEAFHDGRLPAAASAFRHLEPELSGLSDSERARYALYRGLTHLGLGDAREAARWLTFARLLDSMDARHFDAVERGELASAWRSLGRAAGDE
jgi:hypothetical protein